VKKQEKKRESQGEARPCAGRYGVVIAMEISYQGRKGERPEGTHITRGNWGEIERKWKSPLVLRRTRDSLILRKELRELKRM